MMKFANRNLILILVASLVLIPFGSAAMAQEYFETEDPGGGEMLFDLVVVRPIGIVATAIGAVTYVISLPFSALGDNVDVAGQKLLKDPASYTFKRPLGEFRQNPVGYGRGPR
jgi:hypothetical protein